MVQPAKDSMRNNVSEPLNLASAGRVLFQRNVNASCIIIDGVNTSEGRAAGVPKDSIRRFLNHSGGDITDHYIRDSPLGELQLAEQETISAHIIKALGSP